MLLLLSYLNLLFLCLTRSWECHGCGFEIPNWSTLYHADGARSLMCVVIVKSTLGMLTWAIITKCKGMWLWLMKKYNTGENFAGQKCGQPLLNFSLHGKDHHRLYVIINTGWNIHWINFVHDSRGQKFLQPNISSYMIFMTFILWEYLYIAGKFQRIFFATM